jgi:uncharacterized DUF497 family protein
MYTCGVADALDRLSQSTGFQWDEGNAEKNWLKHGVTQGECEEAFFNTPLLVIADEGHSAAESRFYALGQSDAGRGLFIVFTIRGTLLRVISARDMNGRERKEYQLGQASEAPPNP